jgi:transposase-like protein
MGEESDKNPMKQPVAKARREFDDTFKREAVQNWLSSGKSADVIADELGIKPERLYAWKKRFAPADAGGEAAAGAKPMTLAEALARIEDNQREIRHLKEQRDILKKTLGILSEPSPSVTLGSKR